MLGIIAIFSPVIPFAVVAVAVVVDVRTGRGYGLATLLSLLLLSAVLVFATVIISVETKQQPDSIHSPSPAILLLFYYVAAVSAAVPILIGAMIVAGIAGQWRWIIGFFAAVLVPVLGVVPHPFLDQNTEYTVQYVGAIGILAVPVVTMLAFSIKRIVRPVARASARQPAALT